MPRGDCHVLPGNVWRITHQGRKFYEKDPQRNTIFKADEEALYAR
jgi:hypothetical protein